MNDFVKASAFIGKIFSDLWNVCSQYWWVVAGLCIPLVFMLFDLIFDFAYGKGLRKEVIKDKSYLGSYLNKRYRDSQKQNAYKNNDDNSGQNYIVIDGQRYYKSKYQKSNYYNKKSGNKKPTVVSDDDKPSYDIDLFEKMLREQD